MKDLGYHGTCAKHRYSIEKDGFDPNKCKYRSDHWLGQGVYFFDDYEKAKWWASNSNILSAGRFCYCMLGEDYKGYVCLRKPSYFRKN